MAEDFDPAAYLQTKGDTPTDVVAPVAPIVPDLSTPASNNFDPATYLTAKGVPPAAATPAVSSPAPEAPELKTGEEPSTSSRLGSWLREKFSPILGETHDQKLQREMALADLHKISPELAQATQQAVPEAETQVQKGGIKAGAGKVADIVAQGGGAAAGAELGAFGGPAAPVTIPLGGALGSLAGNYLAQKRQQWTGERKDVDPGELAQSAVVGAIPGGSLAKTGAGAVAREAIKQGVGGAAGETARTLVDNNDLPTMRDAAWSSILGALGGAVGEHIQQTDPEITAARKAAQNAVAPKQRVLDAARKEGFVVEPSATNPSVANKAIESLAGGPSVKQQASHINQGVADAIARRVLDPANPDTELTSQVAQAVRKRAYDTGYLPITGAGVIPTDSQFAGDLNNIVAARTTAARSFPGAVRNDVQQVVDGLKVNQFDAGDAIKMTQILRNDASKAFANGDYELGFANRDASKAVESQIERELANRATAGGVNTNAYGQKIATGMLQDFRDARILMAQSHDIEDAIREGSGSVVPSRLGTKYEKQKPLSGGLDVLGAFANNFPTMTREASKTPVPGTTVTGNAARVGFAGLLGGGAAAASHGNPEATTLATAAGLLLPSVRGLVRNLILSEPYQRLMTKIPVNVEAHPSGTALIIRQGTQAVGTQTQDDN